MYEIEPDYPVRKILVLGITMRPSLDINYDVHMTDVLGAIAWYEAQIGEQIIPYELAYDDDTAHTSGWPYRVYTSNVRMQDFDAVFMPTQMGLDRMMGKFEDKQFFLTRAEAYGKALDLALRMGMPIYYIQQDPRPEWQEFLINNQPKLHKQIKILLNSPAPANGKWLAYEAIESYYGHYAGRFIHRPLFPKYNANAKEYEVAIAGMQMDEERSSILKHYLDGVEAIGIGKTGQYAESVTYSKTADIHTMRYHLGTAYATILSYTKWHVLIKHFLTPRLFQGLAWGNMLLVPIEYKEALPEYLQWDGQIVKNSGDVLDRITEFARNQDFRTYVLKKQKEAYYELIA